MNLKLNTKKEYCSPRIKRVEVSAVDSYLYTGSFGFTPGTDSDEESPTI